MDTFDDQKSGQGEIIITLNQEMMFKYDTVIIADNSYQLFKTDTGVEVKTAKQLGHPVVFDYYSDPTNEIAQSYFERPYVALNGKEHVPKERPEPQVTGQSGDDKPIYLAKFAWESFADFIELEQSVGRATNVTEWLLEQNFTQRFVDDYLEAYPEFRTQSIEISPSGQGGGPLNIFVSGIYKIYDRNGVVVPASGASICIFDVNLNNSNDKRVLKNGIVDMCSIANQDGSFIISGINDDPNDNTNADVVLGIRLSNDNFEIINPNENIIISTEIQPRINYSQVVTVGLDITASTLFASVYAYYDDINLVHNYFDDNFSYNIPFLTVQYNFNNSSPSYCDPRDNCIRNNLIEIGFHVGSQSIDSPVVMMHEYGHHIQQSVYAGLGSSIPNCTSHVITSVSSNSCSWSEGWASFIPALVLETSVLDFVFADVNLEIGTEINN